MDATKLLPIIVTQASKVPLRPCFQRLTRGYVVRYTMYCKTRLFAVDEGPATVGVCNVIISTMKEE
jgi:hypothetical protein